MTGFKKRLYLAQVNYRYGENAFFPYSVGRLWAYASQHKEVISQYELGGIIWDRLNPDEAAANMRQPSMLGISHYIWNAEWNKAFALSVKRLHPNCLIVAGGPQVPAKKDKLTDELEYFDVLIHGEGEEAFVDVLLGKLGRGHHIASRSANLDSLPSPYLCGVFDQLLKDYPSIAWQASQETNRGCPYQCTFCDWGSSTYSKVRRFPLDKLFQEIDWFSDNRIELIYNCDANFGMLERDKEITEKLVEAKRNTGFPQKFRASYAKKTTPRVFDIGIMLAKEDMCKGVTLAMQSMDEATQAAVKRKNIPIAQYGEMLVKYRDADVPTYSELILGLPGETRESFIKGVCQVFELGGHDGLNIYPCMLLVNSEMADMKDISVVDVPMILNHASAADELRERYKLVVATPSMPYEHWLDAFTFGWFAQVLHVLGASRVVAMYVHDDTQCSYHDFYTRLYADVKENGNKWPVLWNEMASVVASIHGVVLGDLPSWGSEIDGISWPLEEASFLRIMGQYEKFLSELREWINLQYDDLSTQKLISEQRKRIKKPSEYEHYGRDVVWYGRKGGTIIRPPTQEKCASG